MSKSEAAARAGGQLRVRSEGVGVIPALLRAYVSFQEASPVIAKARARLCGRSGAVLAVPEPQGDLLAVPGVRVGGPC